jgi:heme-degrading monooxygenase HmoA
MKWKLVFAITTMGLFAFLSSCSYTAPFRRVESVGDDAMAFVTLSAVEHKRGQRGAFFTDTQRVLADLPRQAGLIGYSFRFQLLGKKAWTMTAWKSEAAWDAFARSPSHLVAIKNSGVTSENMRFITVQVPASSLPMRWAEALRLLETAPEYGGR